MPCQIVLIEDNEDDRVFFAKALHTVSPSSILKIFDNATDAWQSLASFSVKPEVIFLDLDIPGMNGYEFLFQIKRENTLRSIPIIILSSAIDESTVNTGLKMGARDFATKPNNPQDLETMLHSFLATLSCL